MRALVCSGGGAKGAFQWGALQRLAEQGERFDALYGTSVGALNAAGISLLGIQGLNEVWNNINKMGDIFALSWWTLGPVFGEGLYSHSPLKKLLESKILGKIANIDVTVTKVNNETGQLVYHKLSKGEVCTQAFVDSVLASTCVPFATKPVDHVWFDGGVREQTPLKNAILNGADDITVLMCNPYHTDPATVKRPGFLLRGIKMALRSIEILTHEAMIDDLNRCLKRNGDSNYRLINLTIYAPPVLVTETNGFTQPQIQAARTQGYDLPRG